MLDNLEESIINFKEEKVEFVNQKFLNTFDNQIKTCSVSL